MRFEETLPYLIAQISTVYKASLERSMRAVDLHGGQVFVLLLLWQEDGLSQIRLADKLRVSPPTINKMVKSLASNGYVECRRCVGDGRLMRIFLTEKGRSIRPAVERQWQQLETVLLENLTETEKLILFQLLAKLKDSLAAG